MPNLTDALKWMETAAAMGGHTMAYVSRPRDMRKRERSIYANLLVDAVRRHALLPSELVDKRLRW